MKKIVLFFMGFFAHQICCAQDQNSISVSLLQAGKISSAYSVPLQGTFHGGEVSYHISMANNNDDWIDMLNIKSISITALYLNTGEVSLRNMPKTRGVIGNNYAALAQINSVVAHTGNTSLIISAGSGLSYYTRSFWNDKQYNLINGSHWNAMFLLGLEVQQQLWSGFSISAGLHQTHASVAGWAEPNGGTNDLLFMFGVSKDIDVFGPTTYNHTEDISKQDFFDGGIGFGSRDEVRTGYYRNPKTKQGMFYDTTGHKSGSTNLYQFSFYGGYNHRINQVLNLKVGVDGTYYTHPFTYNNFLKTYQGAFSSYDNWSAGISAGGELLLGRFAVTGMAGRYIHNNFLYNRHYYWTAGAKYFFTPYLALNVKTTFIGKEAHYPSLGIVFTTSHMFTTL